jgi:hypothetical protein
VEKGKILLNSEKLRRDGASLGTQWRFLEQRQLDAPDYRDILTRMENLALDIKRRIPAQSPPDRHPSERTAAQWCEAVQQSVLRVQAATAGESAEIAEPLEKLGHAALTLARMFAAEEAAPAQMVELDSLPHRENRRAAL